MGNKWGKQEGDKLRLDMDTTPRLLTYGRLSPDRKESWLQLALLQPGGAERLGGYSCKYDQCKLQLSQESWARTQRKECCHGCRQLAFQLRKECHSPAASQTPKTCLLLLLIQGCIVILCKPKNYYYRIIISPEQTLYLVTDSHGRGILWRSKFTITKRAK